MEIVEVSLIGFGNRRGELYLNISTELERLTVDFFFIPSGATFQY